MATKRDATAARNNMRIKTNSGAEYDGVFVKNRLGVDLYECRDISTGCKCGFVGTLDGVRFGPLCPKMDKALERVRHMPDVIITWPVKVYKIRRKVR